MTYKTREGAHPTIQVNILEGLPHERYVLTLERIRDAIAAGRPLEYCDDTTPGDKSTSCSWGLCHISKETWPDAQDHIFPLSFEQYGRISPLYRRDGQVCPMDKRKEGDRAYGCFYSCRVFQGYPKPTREEAIELFNQAIEVAKARLEKQS